MVDQTGYREPHDFIGNPPGQDPLGTVVDQKGPIGDHRTVHGRLNRTMEKQMGPWVTIKDHWEAIWHIKGPFVMRNFKVIKSAWSCEF